jgi:hypothetical protein
LAHGRELRVRQRVEQGITAAESPEQRPLADASRGGDGVHRDRARSVGIGEECLGGGKDARQGDRGTAAPGPIFGPSVRNAAKLFWTHSPKF